MIRACLHCLRQEEERFKIMSLFETVGHSAVLKTLVKVRENLPGEKGNLAVETIQKMGLSKHLAKTSSLGEQQSTLLLTYLGL